MSEKTALQTSYDALTAAVGARRSEEVKLSSGGSIIVRGITVMEFINLLRRFPSARSLILSWVGMMVTEDGDEEEDEDRDDNAKLMTALFTALLDEGPEAISVLVAKAMGGERDERVVAKIAELPDDDLILALEAVIGLTMPNGISDFFGRFARIAARLGLKPEEPAEAAEVPAAA
ncbi:hypothetical protein SAMN06297251_10137 [Fulvimarina manganoxydans]|uniref:Uncharacterized protein n=1 Tax=Fulvimarina manganoxydans TaxID=937218 RepID=A0A1W1Y8K8_9HYPH|nr:hypothetical protein [Fulvimarina manganoxydans]SMC32475.1 hypothetical protein SAMN06297251_10137 [Fulvimarina manganoxydans]